MHGKRAWKDPQSGVIGGKSPHLDNAARRRSAHSLICMGVMPGDRVNDEGVAASADNKLDLATSSHPPLHSTSFSRKAGTD